MNAELNFSDIAGKHDLLIKKYSFEPLYPQDFRIVEYNGLFTIERLIQEEHRSWIFGKKHILDKWYDIDDSGNIIFSQIVGSVLLSNTNKRIEPFKDFESALNKIESFTKRITYYLDYKDENHTNNNPANKYHSGLR